MTDPNYTHITFVLDNSGSMLSLRPTTLEGYNSFVEKQKKEPGRATFSLYQFTEVSDRAFIQHLGHSEVPRKPDTVLPTYEFLDLNSVPLLTEQTYPCDNMTPLNDAMGWAVKQTGYFLSLLQEDRRPSKVIFVTLTDGHENYSRVYNRGMVKEMIEHQQSKYGWSFVYLGANQDAIAVGQSYGIAADSSMTYATNDASVGATYNNLSASVIRARSAVGPQGVNFTAEQRADVLNANTVATPVSTP